MENVKIVKFKYDILSDFQIIMYLFLQNFARFSGLQEVSKLVIGQLFAKQRQPVVSHFAAFLVKVKSFIVDSL